MSINARSEFEIRLHRLAAEALQELAVIGIYPSNRIAEIRENNRALKRLGSCRVFSRGGQLEFKLEISARLAKENDKTVKEVIIHELLHTCRGCQNHGSNWKALVDRVNRAYGYRISRTASRDEFPADPQKLRYRLSCKNCGSTSYRMRRSRITDHPENYRCKICGGEIEVTKLEK